MTLHIRTMAGLPTLMIVAACSAPNLDRELKAFSETTGAALSTVEKSLASDAAAERRAGRNAAIQARSPVLAIDNQGCENYLTAATSARAEDCQLAQISGTDLTTDIATAQLELTAAMRAYSQAIGELASSAEPGRISSAAKSLLNNANAVKTSQGLGSANLDLGAIAGPVSRVLGHSANAYKLSLIGRITRETDPAIQRAVRTLVTGIEGRNPKFIAARDDRLDACQTVLDLQETKGPVTDYRNAIGRCEGAQSRLARIDKDTGRAGLMAIGPLHSSLAAAARPGTSFDAILDLVEDLDAATQSLQKGQSQ